MSIEEFESNVTHKLKGIYSFNIEQACFSKGHIPKYILLDRTRNIHSYLIFSRQEGDHLISNNWGNKTFKDDIIKILRIQFSQLDRPLFIIIQDSNDNLRIIEGNMIREYLLFNSSRDINDFIISESANFKDVVVQIKQQL